MSTAILGRVYKPDIIKKVYAEAKKIVIPIPSFQDLVKGNIINSQIKTGGYPYWMSYDKKSGCYKGIYGTWQYRDGGNVEFNFTIDPSNKSLINKFKSLYGQDTLFTYETIKSTQGICGTNILTSITSYQELDARIAKILKAQ